MTAHPIDSENTARALASLRGLAVGDALGSQFFVPSNYKALQNGGLPPGVWQWTDDTEMACSVLAVLAAHGRIDQDALALSFAEHHDFDRGYGPAVNRMLRLIRQEGADWRELAAGLFNGQGSWGNGAAMRVAPLGAWYAGDAEQATHQAEISAYTTHQHREAVVGAMAVAAMAALVADPAARRTPRRCSARCWTWCRPAPCRPVSGAPATCSTTRTWRPWQRCSAAAGVPAPTTPCRSRCGRRPGTSEDYEQAFWTTAKAGGDVDTTCAIVGGIIASRPTGQPPAEWLERSPTAPDVGRGARTGLRRRRTGPSPQGPSQCRSAARPRSPGRAAERRQAAGGTVRP